MVIVADDLGWCDLGCYGSLQNATPQLDELSRQGLLFTDAYAASATCSPTRIALYTGRYPGRIEAGLHEPIIRPDERCGIPAGQPTVPEGIRAAGYATGMIGKWHCGWLPWFSPLRIGFDEFFGNLGGALDYFSHVDPSGVHDLYEGETEVDEIGYYTDLLTARACSYLERQAGDSPFYLQLNYTAPHWPWEGRDDLAVSRRVTAALLRGQPTSLFHFDGGSLSVYRAMVSALDDGVGVLLAALDDMGMTDDTIVIFTSDNGGERYAFMWPLVGEKGDLEEGGIRVPLLLRWPGAIVGGQLTDVAVTSLDLSATLLDLAGAPPAGHALDGTSLLPWLLDGARPPQRDLLWRTREQGALRRGSLKLLFDRRAKRLARSVPPAAGPQARLYDLSVDPREKADLASEHPDLVAELVRAWQQFDHELLPYPPAESAAATNLPGTD